MSSLITEEYKSKRNFKKIIIIIIILIILGLFIYFIVNFIKENKNNNNNENNKVITNDLNSELSDIYGFAISNNYIVSLYNDGSYRRLYNLLQGTGQFGDFTNFFYYDKNLYFLFSDNTIYKMSLNSGNGVYELVKLYKMDTLICGNGSTSKTTDLAFNNKLIYINQNGCNISILNSETLEYNLVKKFNNPSINFEYSNNTNSLYVKTVGKIHLYSSDGSDTVIVDNVSSDKNIKLDGNILLYENNNKYYGYNIKNNNSSLIGSAIEEVTVYNNNFIYRDSKSIYLVNKDSIKEIYKVHYDTLSDMYLTGKDTLQVLDSDSSDNTKKRIINIDLSNNYKVSNEDILFTNVLNINS